MNPKLRELLDTVLNIDLIQIIASNSSDKERCQKIKVRPLLVKKQLIFQASEYVGTKVLHKNYAKKEFLSYIEELEAMDLFFGQFAIETKAENINVLMNKKGTVTIKRKMKKQEAIVNAPSNLEHNRTKQYILPEGTMVPFLVDLGVMTKEGKIVRTKYDKYRQINRFLEFVEDILPSLPKEQKVTILDFGCGKSYLTFAMYYYLKILQGYEIQIIGLDLKEDVIAHCNKLAKNYGYDELQFLVGDIASYEGVNQVDMVVSLHACDTATDYAIFKAIQWNAKVILSVPCCQHELNKQMKETPLDQLFRYGLIKERTAALFTDAIRANLLEQWGYKAQVLEFIDMDHTPKNILIRGVKKNSDTKQATPDKYKKIRVNNQAILSYEDILKTFGIEPTLDKLLTEYKKELEGLV